MLATLAVIRNHKSLSGKVLWHERYRSVLAARVRPRGALQGTAVRLLDQLDRRRPPLSERRSLYHFIALWMTLAAGFTYLFLGFQYHDAGYALGKAVAAGALGAFRSHLRRGEADAPVAPAPAPGTTG
jgi:hypothetical protein